jgi:hypothetical protein
VPDHLLALDCLRQTRKKGRFNQPPLDHGWLSFRLSQPDAIFHVTIIALTRPLEVLMHARSFVVIMILVIFSVPRPLLAKDELPHEFGELVPLYPSAQPVETRYTRDSVTVQFIADDSYERVVGFYAEALEEAGWRILPATSRGVINAEKSASGKDDIELTITEASAMQGHSAGFTIDLHYPGGRE